MTDRAPEPRRLIRWASFAALALAAGALHRLGVVSLLGWAPRPFGEELVPILLGLLVIGHGALLAVPARLRGEALLLTSLACGLLVSAAFTAFGVAWTLAYRRVLWSGARPAVTVLFPIATLLALFALADATHFPAWTAAHPWTSMVSYLFALGWFLRAGGVARGPDRRRAADPARVPRLLPVRAVRADAGLHAGAAAAGGGHRRRAPPRRRRAALGAALAGLRPGAAGGADADRPRRPRPERRAGRGAARATGCASSRW
ncbi:MAG: hypothetical protein IPH44_14105 [Myxococcales bacterium]|nr:hypothetical protein [Myxococcales bacterium]